MAHDSGQLTPASLPVPVAPPTGLRALVVEDEVALATVVGTYLERAGFEVALVHDGLDSVARARQVDPDVVVLDLGGLPRLDGIEVCRQLRTFSDATSSCSPHGPTRSTLWSDSRSGGRRLHDQTVQPA